MAHTASPKKVSTSSCLCKAIEDKTRNKPNVSSE